MHSILFFCLKIQMARCSGRPGLCVLTEEVEERMCWDLLKAHFFPCSLSFSPINTIMAADASPVDAGCGPTWSESTAWAQIGCTLTEPVSKTHTFFKKRRVKSCLNLYHKAEPKWFQYCGDHFVFPHAWTTCLWQLKDRWMSKSDNIYFYKHFLSNSKTHLECQTIMCNITEKKTGRKRKNYMISWIIWFQVDLTSVKTTLQVKEKGLVILKVAHSILAITAATTLWSAFRSARCLFSLLAGWLVSS